MLCIRCKTAFCHARSIQDKKKKYIYKPADITFFEFIYNQRSIFVVAILENSGSNQKEDTYTAGLSISIGFNALLLAVVIILLW